MKTRYNENFHILPIKIHKWNSHMESLDISIKMTYAFNFTKFVRLKHPFGIFTTDCTYAINLSLTLSSASSGIHFIHCLTRSLLMIRLEDQEMQVQEGFYTTNCDIMHFTQATHLHHLLSLFGGLISYILLVFCSLFVLFC